MVKKSLIFIVVCIVSILVVKDYLLRVFLTRYITKAYGVECRMESMQVSLRCSTVETLKLAHRDAEFNLQKGTVVFHFPGFLKPAISQLVLHSARLTIKNPERIKKVLRDRFAGTGTDSPGMPVRLLPSRLALQNTTIELGDTGAAVKGDITFSCVATFNGGMISGVEHFDIAAASLETKHFSVHDAAIKKSDGNVYLVSIPEVTIREESFSDIAIPLQIENHAVVIKKTHLGVFGPSAAVEGMVSIDDNNRLRLELDIRHFSFENILAVMGVKDNVEFNGEYEGKLHIYWRGKNRAEIAGSLYNTTGGVLRINDADALRFLKKRLDEFTYNTLVANLRNYEYNEASIVVESREDTLIFAVKFDSKTQGKRNITIGFHNVLDTRK